MKSKSKEEIDQKKKEASIHREHRKRLRKQAENFGLVNLSEHQVVELLLTYCIPRKDVNEVAHFLIDRFRNLNGIMNAEKSELMKINGIGEVAATFLRFMPEFFRIYIMNKQDKRIRVNSTKEILDTFGDTIKYLNNEELLVILLDKNQLVIDTKNFSSGDRYSVEILKNDILKYILEYRAFAVVFMHNHGSEKTEPSKQDINFTLQMDSILSISGVKFYDHIIVNKESYFSFKNSEEYQKYFLKTDKIYNNKIASLYHDNFVTKFDEFN